MLCKAEIEPGDEASVYVNSAPSLPWVFSPLSPRILALTSEPKTLPIKQQTAVAPCTHFAMGEGEKQATGLLS